MQIVAVDKIEPAFVASPVVDLDRNLDSAVAAGKGLDSHFAAAVQVQPPYQDAAVVVAAAADASAATSSGTAAAAEAAAADLAAVGSTVAAVELLLVAFAASVVAWGHTDYRLSAVVVAAGLVLVACTF